MADYGNIMGFPADTSTADAHYNAALNSASPLSYLNAQAAPGGPLDIGSGAIDLGIGAAENLGGWGQLLLGYPFDQARQGLAHLSGVQLNNPDMFTQGAQKLFDAGGARMARGLDAYTPSQGFMATLLGGSPVANASAAASSTPAQQGATQAAITAPPVADAGAAVPAGVPSPVALAARTSGATSGSSPLLQHMLKELHDKAMGNGVSAYQDAVKRHLGDLPSADLDAAANDAAAKMGLPNEGVEGMSKHNKTMLLLQMGLGMMSAASQPGANFFGALAHGGQTTLGALGDLQKQRHEAMKDARQEALQNWELKRTGVLDAASAAQAEQAASDRQFQNQLGVGTLGAHIQANEETHQDRMAATAERERVARARVAAKNNVLGIAQKMAHDQFTQQSNPLTNPAALDAGFKPKSEADFLEEILSRSPQWQALQTADAMDGTFSAPLGMLGSRGASAPAAPPPGAVEYLAAHKNDPAIVAQFKQKYGTLPQGF